MKHHSGFRVALLSLTTLSLTTLSLTTLSLTTIASALAQQQKFEMADVHVSTTAHSFAQNFGGVLRAGKYVNRDATMLNLIEAAYGVSEDSIAGGPGWLNADLFDVIGKVPDGTTPATAKLMLQSLLADRFKLVIRNDTRPVPRYVLSVGKGGSKLKPADGSGNPGCQPKQQPGAGGGNGGPADPASHPNIQGGLPRPDGAGHRGEPASDGRWLSGSRCDRLDEARRLVGLRPRVDWAGRARGQRRRGYFDF